MINAFVYFSFRLCYRFTHFLSDQGGVSLFVVSQIILQVVQFFEASIQTCISLQIFESKTLVRALQRLLKVLITHCLESTVQFVIFGVN